MGLTGRKLAVKEDKRQKDKDKSIDMKKSFPFLLLVLLATACTSTKNLTYLNNLPKSEGPQYFPYNLQDYKVQYRDILYVDVKAGTPDGKIENVLQGSSNVSMNYIQSESSQYLIGFNVDKDGNILLPVIGGIAVGGKDLKEIRKIIQVKIDSVYNHAYVDVKLLSFKFTVLGEARNPGTYINYNDYLTVLEAIGRAGGIGDYGRHDRLLVVRSTPEGSKTFVINLQDKSILSSEAYFLMPNDVVIIEPAKHKILNMNLPTFSFIISAVTGVITTTLLLVNYFGK
jgi:polysaccharide biosynthesis/export protein